MKVISIPHAGRVAVLIATDVASRGLDIKDITYVTVSNCIPATHNSMQVALLHTSSGLDHQVLHIVTM